MIVAVLAAIALFGAPMTSQAETWRCDAYYTYGWIDNDWVFHPAYKDPTGLKVRFTACVDGLRVTTAQEQYLGTMDYDNGKLSVAANGVTYRIETHSTFVKDWGWYDFVTIAEDCKSYPVVDGKFQVCGNEVRWYPNGTTTPYVRPANEVSLFYGSRGTYYVNVYREVFYINSVEQAPQ